MLRPVAHSVGPGQLELDDHQLDVVVVALVVVCGRADGDLLLVGVSEQATDDWRSGDMPHTWWL